MSKLIKILLVKPGQTPAMADTGEGEHLYVPFAQDFPKEYMMVGNRLCATPNELLLATYDLWDDLAPGESVMLTKGGQGA